MKRDPVTENDVKELVKDWFKARRGWSYAPVQSGLGEHGIHDRVGGIPITVTPEMVGKTVAILTTVESKRPGRRGEPRRGMSHHQEEKLNDVLAIGGLSIVCDGREDLAGLDAAINVLTGAA